MTNYQKSAVKFLTGILLLSTAGAFAQLSKGPRAELASITRPNHHSGWIYFKDDLQLRPGDIFSRYKAAWALGADDELRLQRSMEMYGTGMEQQRYQQYYKGVKVHGAVFNLYLREGLAVKANGRLVHDLVSGVTPDLSEEQALASALRALDAQDYGWNDIRYVNRFRKSRKDPNADPYPHGELVFMYQRERSGFNAADYRLCWKFDVPMARSVSYTLYVDAGTGTVVNRFPLTLACGGATVNLPFNGAQTIYTSQRNTCGNPSYWELTDDCGVLIEIINDNYGGTESPICNNSSANSWPVSTGIFGDGMQVNYGMRKTANFYASHFGWNSYDDAGGSLDCRVAYEFTDDNGNPTGNNARYDEFMEDFDFGYGATGLDAQDSYTCIDITGHEFTHGVDDYTADLDYQDESGALDESFADIFGELVEIYTEGPQAAGDAWKVANDKSTGSIRSMANPISFNDPDTYLGTNWYSGSNDNGGVHTNSGVQNHCFYLLCEGGSGFNSNGDYYDVNGIGTDDAKEIAFLAHQYLWGTAAFIDSRDAWLEAASDLYGSCSQQSIQTGNAWYAVGVGAQSPYNSKMVSGVQNALIAHNTQEAIENVFSLGQVDINSVSGGPYEVRFFAGVDVTLSVGFTAASGSAFLADINPCSITLHTALRGAAPTTPVLPAAIAEQQGHLKLLAAPNPFSHSLRVSIEGMDGESEARLAVFDLNGKLVYSGTTLPLVEGAGEVLLDLSPLQQGLYFLEVNGSGGQLIRHKLVKLK